MRPRPSGSPCAGEVLDVGGGESEYPPVRDGLVECGCDDGHLIPVVGGLAVVVHGLVVAVDTLPAAVPGVIAVEFGFPGLPEPPEDAEPGLGVGVVGDGGDQFGFGDVVEVVDAAVFDVEGEVGLDGADSGVGRPESAAFVVLRGVLEPGGETCFALACGGGVAVYSGSFPWVPSGSAMVFDFHQPTHRRLAGGLAPCRLLVFPQAQRQTADALVE